MSAGLFIFIAFVLGSILKIAIPFYNRWKLDGRPFNLQYLEPLVISVGTAFPAIVAAFVGWNPPISGEIMTLIALAFLAGWGESDGIKVVFEYLGLINIALNKAQELIIEEDGSEFETPEVNNTKIELGHMLPTEKPIDPIDRETIDHIRDISTKMEDDDEPKEERPIKPEEDTYDKEGL